MKVLVKKSFLFVEAIWNLHIQKNMENLQPVTDMQQSRVTEDDDETPEDGDAVSDDEEDEED
jgi:hypothetical protein